jgi:hypothetical protein
VPTVARRLPLVGAALVALVGVVLLVLGLWVAIGLGPAGRAEFSTTRQTPGIELVGSTVLAHVDAPVEVTVTRADGGPVWLGLAHDADARSAVGSSPHLSVDRVHYPSGAVDVSTIGAGASKAAQLQGGDVWQHTSTGTGTARLVVSPEAAPLSVVATSANAAALGRVRTTLAWQHRTWFFEALAAAALGLAIAALALGYLRHARRRPAPQRAAEATGATRATRGTRRAQTPSGQPVGTSVPPQASGTGQVGRE